MNFERPWSDAEDRKLAEMIWAESGRKDIAKALDRSIHSIYARAFELRRRGVELPSVKTGRPKVPGLIQRLPRHQDKNAKMKSCMCCKAEFMSAGSMNRLCTRCRHQSTSPYEP